MQRKIRGIRLPLYIQHDYSKGGFTMNIEKKRMESAWLEGKEIFGHITLEKLAIPETVHITVFGKEVFPQSFDCYGHPNFTAEQWKMFQFKEFDFARYNSPLYFKIQYEERIFDVPRSSFDSVQGIEKALTSLSDLNECLNNRKIFRKVHRGEQLNQFVLYGLYQLNEFGQIVSVISQKKGVLLSTNSPVEKWENFCTYNYEGVELSTNRYQIPTSGVACPCCGETFTIEDVQKRPCVFEHGKYYHDECWRGFQKMMEIDKFTRELVNRVYPEYRMELLPNGFWHEDRVSHIPWFLFHTIDGDIIMGRKKHVISIEWQENFKAFNVNDVFREEKANKWKENGKQGICAWNEIQAYDYLVTVAKTVNPNFEEP